MLQDRCSCLLFLHSVIIEKISASHKVHSVYSLIFFFWLACLQKRNKYFFFKFLVLGVFFQNEWTFLPRLLPFVSQKAQSNSCKDSFPLSSHDVQPGVWIVKDSGIHPNSLIPREDFLWLQ